MRECMITNICSMAAGSIAIAVACTVTKSALPLFAFLLVPRWTFTTTRKEDEESIQED